MAKHAVKSPTTRRGRVRLSAAYSDLLDYSYEYLVSLEEFVQDLMEDLVFFGEDRMKDMLEAAVTATGQARVAAGGGSPGRVDTGAMKDAITTSIEDRGEKSYRGEWGWLGTVMEYYLFQEYGDAGFNVKFQGMKALQQSYIETRELMLQRLQEAGIQVH